MFFLSISFSVLLEQNLWGREGGLFLPRPNVDPDRRQRRLVADRVYRAGAY